MKQRVLGSLALALLGCSPGRPALQGGSAPGASGTPEAPGATAVPTASPSALAAPEPSAGAPPGPGTPAQKHFRLGGCTIELGEIHASRDWMPVVNRPGKDGGTPLRGAILFSVQADRSRGCAPRATAMLTDAAEPMGPVDLVIPGMGTVFLGEIAPGASLDLGARAIEGPYRAPHTRVWFSLMMHDPISGERLTITTTSVLIDASS